MIEAKTLTDQRHKVHGDWMTQSRIADNIMYQLEHSPNWEKMGPERRQALFNIAQKMSRICSGDYEEPDHFDDIGGYALLGNRGHRTLAKQATGPVELDSLDKVEQDMDRDANG